MAMAAGNTPTASLLASLPMYDWPEVAPCWDLLWAKVRARLADIGISAEPELRREGDRHDDWRDPALILGQTCGWPYVSGVRDCALPIARFDFGLQTARPGDYYSVFIAPPGGISGVTGPRSLEPILADPSAILAINDTGSQSGCRVLGECLAEPMKIPAKRLLMTGSHRESIRAVAEGMASLAAIDAVSWQFALKHERAARKVVILAHSADAPGLPLIVSRRLANHAATVFDALSAAVKDLPADARSALGLKGVVPASDADYGVLLEPPYGNLGISGWSAPGS